MLESPEEAGGIAELRRVVELECTIALDPHFARAYTDLVATYRVMSSEVDIGTGTYARAAALLVQLESNNPDDPAIWDIQVQLERDMVALADQCHTAIRKGLRVHAYPHPTGLLDVRSAYARALAHSGLPREALGYFSLVNREGEPNLSDTRLAMCACLIACGEFERAIELCDRIRESPTANLTAAAWEVAARVALHDLDGAAAVSVPYASDYRSFTEPLIAAKRDPAIYVGDEASRKGDALDMRGYCLLAIGETVRGLDHLERAVAAQGADYHWMAFRLPIFRPLFDANVSRHPRYQAVLAALKIDPVSRERMRAQAATLTPITGVEAGPLLDL
jgi:tetratricopeptide (TPR) repeat protein